MGRHRQARDGTSHNERARRAGRLVTFTVYCGLCQLYQAVLLFLSSPFVGKGGACTSLSGSELGFELIMLCWYLVTYHALTSTSRMLLYNLDISTSCSVFQWGRWISNCSLMRLGCPYCWLGMQEKNWGCWQDLKGNRKPVSSWMKVLAPELTTPLSYNTLLYFLWCLIFPHLFPYSLLFSVPFLFFFHSDVVIKVCVSNWQIFGISS